MMRLQFITLRGIKLDSDVYEVILPTAAGEIAVFPGHEPLVALAIPGVVKVRHKKQDADEALELFAISGGVVEIGSAMVRILVDEADHGDDIIEAESKAALERALKLRDEAQDQIELDEAHKLIHSHTAKLKVAELRRRPRR